MQSNSVSDNKRIAKNTLMLYSRMLLTMAVGLYAARIVLQTLGASDYGLYNVVGGIVTMFTFLNGTLATGTQRFLTFALGEDDPQKLRDVFSTASYLHVLFAVIILIISEIVGLWLLYNQMQIPDGRMDAAFWVFQFSTMAAMVAIVRVPYTSSLIAHEKMDIYAWVSIYDAVMKLVIVYLIQVVDTDKLILYAFLFFLVHVSTALIYILYCRNKYEECRMFRCFNKDTFREIASFSGWNIFGCGAVALQGQGVNILLNMFFGTIVNAARGIAFQVNSIILQFVNNFQTAVNPQIVKLYAAGNKSEMIKLMINNSKLAAYLLLILAIPVFIELEFVLEIWLGEYPDYTPIFLRIIIVQSLVQTMTRPIVMGLHATGRLKMPNLTAGIILLMILPVCYLLLRLGLSPVSVFVVNVIPWVLETFIDSFWLYKFIDFPIGKFYKEVYGRVFPLSILMFAGPFSIYRMLESGWISFFAVCATSIICSLLCIAYLGITKEQRISGFNFVRSKLLKIK